MHNKKLSEDIQVQKNNSVTVDCFFSTPTTVLEPLKTKMNGENYN